MSLAENEELDKRLVALPKATCYNYRHQPEGEEAFCCLAVIQGVGTLQDEVMAVRRSNKTLARSRVGDTGSAEWHPTIKDLPPSDRPTERLLENGATSLSTPELIAVILRTGTEGRNVTRLAEDLLAKAGGLNGLLRAPISEIRTHRGIGKVKVAQLKAALEIGRRLREDHPEERRQVRSPADIADMLLLEMGPLEHEQFRVVLLDNKNRVVSVRKLYDGSVNTSIVRVAEVFRDAIRENCAALVVVHNHPSGDPAPSSEDVRVTKEIVQAGRLLQIDVLDHVILGRSRFESLKQRGLGFE